MLTSLNIPFHRYPPFNVVYQGSIIKSPNYWMEGGGGEEVRNLKNVFVQGEEG